MAVIENGNFNINYDNGDDNNNNNLYNNTMISTCYMWNIAHCQYDSDYCFCLFQVDCHL